MNAHKVDVLAVMDAFSATPAQVCCGFAVGGGMDDNGNGEPPSCCGQPFDTDMLREARAAVAELIERAEYLCRTGEGMIAFRAALARIGGGT